MTYNDPTFWLLFAVGDRMRDLLFTRLVPGYVRLAELDRDVTTAERVAARHGRPWDRSIEMLARFVRAIQAHGTKLCLVAVPTLHPEWDDPYEEVRTLAGAARIGFVDLRRMPGVPSTAFRDKAHMTPAGRAWFSHRLAEALADAPGCAGRTPRGPGVEIEQRG